MSPKREILVKNPIEKKCQGEIEFVHVGVKRQQ